MKSLFFIGGPLIVCTGLALYSDLLTYGEQNPGMMHFAGAELGGMFNIKHTETYQCDESGANCVLVDEKTEFSEVEGLELELDPIEYREGDEVTTVRKLNGMNKYGPIYLRRGGFDDTDFDWSTWRFEFQRQAEIERVNQEFDKKIEEAQSASE